MPENAHLFKSAPGSETGTQGMVDGHIEQNVYILANEQSGQKKALQGTQIHHQEILATTNIL